METILILTNLPDRVVADKLANALVTERLAACVNILPPCTSVYRWEGKVDQANEVPMVIKSTKNLFSEVEKVILNHHPYELPEIITLKVDGGSTAYLQWVGAQLIA